MTKKVKKISVYLSLVVIPFGAATVGLVGKASHAKQVSTVVATQETDAAFRDGFYLGKLDAESGRKPHLSIGRWNTARDRASFVAGYQQGYRQVHGVKIGE
jgi:hypothetical protein